jgi:hypothetical protein
LISEAYGVIVYPDVLMESHGHELKCLYSIQNGDRIGVSGKNVKTYEMELETILWAFSCVLGHFLVILILFNIVGGEK